jgi:hypothetical protein
MHLVHAYPDKQRWQFVHWAIGWQDLSSARGGLQIDAKQMVQTDWRVRPGVKWSHADFPCVRGTRTQSCGAYGCIDPRSRSAERGRASYISSKLSRANHSPSGFKNDVQDGHDEIGYW